MTKLTIPLALVCALLSVGCGEKQDYSGTGDLGKASADPGTVPHPEKGAPTASPAEAVGQSKRPDGH